MAEITNSRILIAGDSTAASYQANAYPMMGWGQALNYFTAPDVEIMNYAQPGRSSRSFLEEGHWEALLKAISPHSLVFIQFGHNDQKKDCPLIYTSLEQFGDNLTKMVFDVQTSQAFPVLLTPFPRCIFGYDGRLSNTHNNYPEITRTISEQLQCMMIDVNKLAHQRFINPAETYRYYTYPSPGIGGFTKGTQDISHFNISGAHEMAKLVVDECIDMDSGLCNWFVV